MVKRQWVSLFLLGALGCTGTDGKAGERGAQGVQGEQGTAGQPGAHGEVGAAGADGSMGVQGPSGTGGVPGPAGPPGDAGATGEAGARGPSGNASVCGATATTYQGNVGGYPAAKALCPAACGGLMTARVCTAQEAAVAAQLGSLGALTGRVVSGVSFLDGAGTFRLTDCDGFNSSDAYALAITFSAAGPQRSGCANMAPFLCCN